jgi:EmrB/QacA subfamily drug resistance transporter
MGSDVKSASDSKERLIVASIVLGMFMTSLDATIVSVALPSMAENFFGSRSTDTGTITSILLAYTLTVCSFVMLWGKIGTNVGYKRVFILGIAIFTFTSLVIGLTGLMPSFKSIGLVIAMRAVQGLGAGMAMGMSMAMVSSYLKRNRGLAMSKVSLAAALGTACGPAVGGILTHFDWSYIFFINVPIGIFCILLSSRAMSGVETPSERKGIDAFGALLLFVMLFSFILYLNRGGDMGWGSAAGIGLVALTVLAAAGLFLWERRSSDPIVPPSLIRNRSIISANLACLSLFGAMAGSYLLVPYYLEYVMGYSQLEYGVALVGIIMIANSLGMLAVSPFVGKVADRTGRNRPLISAGCLVAALGFFMLSRLDQNSEIWLVLASLFVMGVGGGMALVASTNLAFSHIKEGEDGQVSGLINTFRQAGSSLGVSIMQLVFVSSITAAGVALAVHPLFPGFGPAFLAATGMAVLAFLISLFAKDGPRRTSDEV